MPFNSFFILISPFLTSKYTLDLDTLFLCIFIYYIFILLYYIYFSTFCILNKRRSRVSKFVTTFVVAFVSDTNVSVSRGHSWPLVVKTTWARWLLHYLWPPKYEALIKSYARFFFTNRVLKGGGKWIFLRCLRDEYIRQSGHNKGCFFLPRDLSFRHRHLLVGFTLSCRTD